MSLFIPQINSIDVKTSGNDVYIDLEGIIAAASKYHSFSINNATCNVAIFAPEVFSGAAPVLATIALQELNMSDPTRNTPSNAHLSKGEEREQVLETKTNEMRIVFVYVYAYPLAFFKLLERQALSTPRHPSLSWT